MNSPPGRPRRTRYWSFEQMPKEHWEAVYASKSDAEPRTSLSLIEEVCAAGRVIDVGGGVSVLAERLLERGYSVTVLDISQTALDRARSRLEVRASEIHWIVADVTEN